MFRIAGILVRKQLCNLAHCARQNREITTALISPRTPVFQSSVRSLCGDGGRRTDEPPPSLPSQGGGSYDFDSGHKPVYPPLIDDVCRILRDVNAMDMCVIEVPPERHYLKYVVLVCGKSSRHLRAMSSYLVSQYKQSYVGPHSSLLVHGRKAPEWMIVELGNMVVHFLSSAERERLELEKLWTLGPAFDDQYSAMVSMRTEEKLWPDGKGSKKATVDEGSAFEDGFEEEEGEEFEEDEAEEEEEEEEDDQEDDQEDLEVHDDLDAEEYSYEDSYEDEAEEEYYDKEAREYNFEADKGGFDEENSEQSVKTRPTAAENCTGKNLHGSVKRS